MNLRCAIVDDEPLALGLLESYIKKTPFLELSGSYSSAIQAMKYLPDHPVDVLFLDIQMPELNGLEFSRMVSDRPILSLVSMRVMEEKLPANQFIRVHRSFIVQKQKIKVIDKGRIVFGKDYIPISDSYKQELQNYVNEHIV